MSISATWGKGDVKGWHACCVVGPGPKLPSVSLLPCVWKTKSHETHRDEDVRTMGFEPTTNRNAVSIHLHFERRGTARLHGKQTVE